VKIATSWWALEKLGPDHRFLTRFSTRGTIDSSHGLLMGDLIVHGSGDPDFQADNAFLVAQELNRMGVRKVSGSVIVDSTFWMGWENGSQGMNPDPVKRATLMAARLRAALDVRRWNRATRRDWYDFAEEHGRPRAPEKLFEGRDGQHVRECVGFDAAAGTVRVAVGLILPTPARSSRVATVLVDVFTSLRMTSPLFESCTQETASSAAAGASLIGR